MRDSHDHIFSAEQPSFEALREEFREANRQRIHKSLREDEIVIRDKEGREVARKKTGYLTDALPGHEHRRVDDWIAAGGRVPVPSKEFIIPDSPGLQKELKDLKRDAELVEKHYQVEYDGGADGSQEKE